MNPRQFCRELGYDTALVLTYSFDPIFFEKVVLPDLRSGGTGRVVVIADRSEADEAIARTAGLLKFGGRRYVLSEANGVGGAFHPKMILRFGPEGGAAMLATGNVTSGGWGGNRELATAWRFGPELPDIGAWVRPLLEDVMKWSGKELDRMTVAQVAALPWLPAAGTKSTSPVAVLHSHSATTLASQLASRWAGRKFKTLHAMTGSTDDKGAMLRWARNTFGVEKFVLAVTPAASSLRLNLIADLNLTIVPVTDEFQHAKFYWFDGDDGPAAIFGSANCSAAAWLVPPSQAGNVEAVICYDRPLEADFGDALALLSETPQRPTEALPETPKASDNEKPLSPRYRLTAAVLTEETQRVSFSLSPVPREGVTVVLAVDEILLTCSRAPGGQSFLAEFPEGVRSAVPLCIATITDKEGVTNTPPRWLDCVGALAEAESNVTYSGVPNLEGKNGQREQSKVARSVQTVMEALFAGISRDPMGKAIIQPAGAKRTKPDDATRAGDPLDPISILCAIDEVNVPDRREATQGNWRELSLTGLMRLLFTRPDDDGGDAEAPQAGESADDERGHKDDKGRAANEKEENGPEPTDVDARHAAKVHAAVETCLEQMAETWFIRNCTASNLAQAAAFPLAIAEFGRKEGWVIPELADAWVARVISLLFDSRSGLLKIVRERYASADRADEFAEEVGHGALWALLVTVVTNSAWSAISTFDKALMIRAISREKSLLGSADASRLRRLICELRVKDAFKVMTRRVPAIVIGLDKLEHLIDSRWEEATYRKGGAANSPWTTGDLLYRKGVAGWVTFVRELPCNRFEATRLGKAMPFQESDDIRYVNVTQVSLEDANIANALRIVVQASQGRGLAMEVGETFEQMGRRAREQLVGLREGS
ncbi:hypothetical protein JJQ59_34980 (plasmid) [Cupriavidus necator]|uniref:Phospholipase D-like domain-containing protein n=1 Tax=Cupriavidus necator TaxID=106590 RepID=A0A367PU88_CUPNE|nr:hypothetical protein [Cupriavidus necator]QQX89731.1 hypothetical protein JJQ59_34980 [Cupriavidus necator]RCJ10455.1 hypothetical protein DDK22_00370 [Cupriavidus necator]